MRIAIYPGSFDPITNGHMDIIKRACKLFDKLIIGILKNNSKSPLFTSMERVQMISELFHDVENIEVIAFDGLLIDFAHQMNAEVIVRGLRVVTDFEYELQLSQANRVVAPDIDTIFFNTNLKYSYLSSSIVKEVATFGGDISAFVHPSIEKLVFDKMKEASHE